VREQIRATYDSGLEGWVLWNPRSVYIRGYFKADSIPVDAAGAATRP
jgi:hypothetical protein